MKILLQCNVWMKGSDYRYGLITTLMRSHELNQLSLSCDLVAAYAIFKPDVIISIKGEIPELMKGRVKRDGCKTIQLWPDDPDQIERGMELIPQFDYYFTNSMEAQKMYFDKGFNDVKVCCFAVDYKLVEKVKPDEKYKCDVLFAGGDNKKRYRCHYLNNLEGLDLRVYGKWMHDVYGHQNKILYGDEYFSALKSCKIGIDLSESGAGYMNIKSKTFELAAAGCLVMANKFEEMENYFEYGKEIVGFGSPEDLRDKVEYYLKHEDERLEIARAGHVRFLKEYTWEQKLKMIFKECGL